MEMFFNFGVYRREGDFKEFTFYGESGDTDYRINVSYFPGEGVIVEEKLCGRDRASVWSDPEDDFSSEGFWATVLEQAARFGGLSQVGPYRIGEKEYW